MPEPVISPDYPEQAREAERLASHGLFVADMLEALARRIDALRAAAGPELIARCVAGAVREAAGDLREQADALDFARRRLERAGEAEVLDTVLARAARGAGG